MEWVNSEWDQKVHVHQTSLWTLQIPRLFKVNDISSVAVSRWPLSLAVTSVSDGMGPGHAGTCAVRPAAVLPQLCRGQMLKAPLVVSRQLAESGCGLFWSSDFVSGHRAEIWNRKDCVPPGACSRCDLRRYLQVTRFSINLTIQIFAVLSARCIISW